MILSNGVSRNQLFDGIIHTAVEKHQDQRRLKRTVHYAVMQCDFMPSSLCRILEAFVLFVNFHVCVSLLYVNYLVSSQIEHPDQEFWK
jgi:hypothetical protein